MLDFAVVSAMFLLLSEHINPVPQAVVLQCPLLDQRGLPSLLPQFLATVPLLDFFILNILPHAE